MRSVPEASYHDGCSSEDCQSWSKFLLQWWMESGAGVSAVYFCFIFMLSKSCFSDNSASVWFPGTAVPPTFMRKLKGGMCWNWISPAFRWDLKSILRKDLSDCSFPSKETILSFHFAFDCSVFSHPTRLMFTSSRSSLYERDLSESAHSEYAGGLIRYSCVYQLSSSLLGSSEMSHDYHKAQLLLWC